MRIAQEEIFGPVLTALPFSTEEEALEIANDVRYGLTGYLWTNDLTRALRFTESLEAGMIWVNSENVRHLPTPFGGVKAAASAATAATGPSNSTWRPNNIGSRHRPPTRSRASAPEGGKPCPSPHPYLTPPFNIVRLSHVEFGVTDLAASRAFYCGHAGPAGHRRRRTARSICVRWRSGAITAWSCAKATRPRSAALSFKVFAEEDLDKAADWFAGKGHRSEWVERPFQGRTLRTRTSSARRWSSTPGWTACRRSTSSTSSTTG